MNILNKILSLFKRDKINEPNFQIPELPKITNEPTANDSIENYLKEELIKANNELERLNLRTVEDLENLILKLIRPATKLEIQKPTKPPENSQLTSHFGGQPYYEEGDEFVKSKNGNNMTFIFQIFNNEELTLPNNIKLLQFFYDWDKFPWETAEDGWKVKIYENLNLDNIIKIENITNHQDSKYCEIRFNQIKSLPNWDGIYELERNAVNLSHKLNPDNPWEKYQETVVKLLGEQVYQSQLGGYPRWVQSDGTPFINDTKRMNLLFQIDSEDNAGLMWGDVGLIYVFYDEETKRIEFLLQCH